MNSGSHYDVAIIGAGLSGLAAGIRLAHFGKKVCLFERHNAVGGLNGFYSIDGRRYDVGLHAMTNFVPKGVKGTPLGKLLRQLRIEREEFALCPQKRSRIAFGAHGEVSLAFTNDLAVLEAEIAARFPSQRDGFAKVVAYAREKSLVFDAPPASARAFLAEHLSDPLLRDMILCPLMYYGSAREGDMDLGQFAIMFRALFLEGFARPFEGVRVIMRVLNEKYRAAGGERRMKCGVRRLVTRGGRATALILDSGEAVTAEVVLSSIGSDETKALWQEPAQAEPVPRGRLSFVETITVLDRQPAAFGWGDDAIVFFNDSDRFTYARPTGPVDTRSGVICIPNNFDFAPGQVLPEGLFRCTCLANFEQWTALAEPDYQAAKRDWYGRMQASVRRFLPPLAAEEAFTQATLATDMFTPRTVAKFTGHIQGAIYGAPDKVSDGRTALSNVFLCGTDQGLLGIVGAMLSGISIANARILQPA